VNPNLVRTEGRAQTQWVTMSANASQDTLGNTATKVIRQPILMNSNNLDYELRCQGPFLVTQDSYKSSNHRNRARLIVS